MKTVIVKDKAGNDVVVNEEDAPNYAEWNKEKPKKPAKKAAHKKAV
jgi:hypothetical protein